MSLQKKKKKREIFEFYAYPPPGLTFTKNSRTDPVCERSSEAPPSSSAVVTNVVESERGIEN